MKTRKIYILISLILFISCRKDEIIFTSENVLLPISPRPESEFAIEEPIGMYLLNEGNMGSNKSSIDYVDFCNGCYLRNIYSERNPTIIKELGDVGNDIQIYGSKLYAVINLSHKIEVMNVKTCERIGQIDIPNCRKIRFCRGKAYISSYISSEVGNGDEQGAVFQVDTTTLQITNKVTVGFQPEEMEFVGNYLYVVNSGGYRSPNYDNTISVVDLSSMKQIKKIPVWENLYSICKDNEGNLWVSAQGNYNEVTSNLILLSLRNETSIVADTLHIPCSKMCIKGDSLYFFSVEWNEQLQTNHISYGIINVKTKKRITNNFISDNTSDEIKIPYALAVNPYNGDIYVSDAKNYVSSGVLHCYSKYGKRKWSVRTGDIPAHIAFVYK